jgi:hypothetical protein
MAAKMLTSYPYKSFGLSLYFLHQLETLLEDSSHGKPEGVDFNNRELQAELGKLPSKRLYPENDDIYLDFKIQSEADLSLTFTKAIKKTQTLKGNLMYSLELYHENRLMLEIFGEQYSIEFINYLLTFVVDIEISRLLLSLYLPKANDLKTTIEKFIHQKQEYKNIHQKLSHLLSQTLIVGISGKK